MTILMLFTLAIAHLLSKLSLPDESFQNIFFLTAKGIRIRGTQKIVF